MIEHKRIVFEPLMEPYVLTAPQYETDMKRPVGTFVYWVYDGLWDRFCIRRSSKYWQLGVPKESVPKRFLLQASLMD